VRRDSSAPRRGSHHEIAISRSLTLAERALRGVRRTIRSHDGRARCRASLTSRTHAREQVARCRESVRFAGTVVPDASRIVHVARRSPRTRPVLQALTSAAARRSCPRVRFMEPSKPATSRACSPSPGLIRAAMRFRTWKEVKPDHGPPERTSGSNSRSNARAELDQANGALAGRSSSWPCSCHASSVARRARQPSQPPDAQHVNVYRAARLGVR